MQQEYDIRGINIKKRNIKNLSVIDYMTVYLKKSHKRL